jgi:hypothetical protein
MLDRWSSVRSILASSARSIVYRMPFSGELQILTDPNRRADSRMESSPRSDLRRAPLNDLMEIVDNQLS